MTQSGASVGTIAYMAPEQATGGESTGATDVFGACLVLYEGLAGRNPLATGNAAATAQRAANCQIPDLARLRPGLPADLVAVVRDGLSRSPSARPSAAEAARRLREAVARMRGSREVSERTRGRRRAVLATASVAISAGALGSQIIGDPVAAVGLGAAAAAAAVLSPLLVLLALALGLVLWVGATAPGMGLALAAVIALAAIPMRRRGHVLAVPALAPVLFLSGAGLLYALVAGGLARRGERLWAVAVGCAAAAWAQIWSGAGGLLLADAALTPARVSLEGDARPAHALERVVEPLLAAPAALVGALVVALMALLVPTVRARRAGAARLVVAALWALAGVGVGTRSRASAAVRPLVV